MIEEELYVKISRRMHVDGSFRRLSRPPPNAQSLWQYLLEGPHVGRIPGLFSRGILSLAESLKWEVPATRACLEEILSEEMAKVDLDAPLIWLPGALHHNKPSSPNVVAGWAREWSQLPECALREEAAEWFRARLREIGPAFAASFERVAPRDRPSRKGIPTSSRKTHPDPFAKTPPGSSTDPFVIQDLDLDLDQEQNQDLSCEADREPDTKRARVAPPAAPPQPPIDRLPDGHPNALPTLDDIQAMLRKHKCLAAMADDPESVEHLQCIAVAGGKRNGEVERAITDWVVKESPKWRHIPVQDLCGKVGLFVSWAKRLREETQPAGAAQEDISPEANATLAAYLFAFSKANNGEERELDDWDRKAAQKVYALAEQAVPKSGKGATPIMVLNHKLRQYMTDPDAFVVRKRYPLALLETRWGQYTLPAQWRAPIPQPEEPAQPRQSNAEHLANLKALTAALPGAKDMSRASPRIAAPTNPPPPVQHPDPPVKANVAPANGHLEAGSYPPDQVAVDDVPEPPSKLPEPAGPELVPHGSDPGAFYASIAGPEQAETITVNGVAVDAELAALAPDLVGRTMGRRRLMPPGLVATAPPEQLAQAPPTREGFMQALGGIGSGPREMTPEIREYAKRRNGGSR